METEMYAEAEELSGQRESATECRGQSRRESRGERKD
jgi:hypothetical protein